ncbi:hypothetical protein U1Q18_011404, partial [Sarracenia purpurea var. burkii]
SQFLPLSLSLSLSLSPAACTSPRCPAIPRHCSPSPPPTPLPAIAPPPMSLLPNQTPQRRRPLCALAPSSRCSSVLSPDRLFVSADDDPSDFLIDFEMDDKFLSDLVNTEFSPFCDADHGDNT